VSVVYAALGILVILVLPAYLSGRVARGKGRPFGLYFAAGLLLGPIVLIATLLLPRHRRVA
jgi:hypothetical protein